MTKRHSAAGPATAMSPYLSLREAVRPAIYAYGVLARERGQSTALVVEANNLLTATEDLLAATGLVHILIPDPQDEMAFEKGGQDRQARLIAAYSEAGMKWARVVGTCLALADALAAEARWEDAYRLASYLKAAGEHNAATDVLALTEAAKKKAEAYAQKKAQADAFQARYAALQRRLSEEMPVRDIKEAISIIQSASYDPPVRLQMEQRLRRPLVTSIASYVSRRTREDPTYQRYQNDPDFSSLSSRIRQVEEHMANEELGGDEWERLFQFFHMMYNHLGEQ